MGESPAGPDNDVQRDQEQASTTSVACTPVALHQDVTLTCAGDVPLGNARNVECSRNESDERWRGWWENPSRSSWWLWFVVLTWLNQA